MSSTHFEDEDFKFSESHTMRLKEGACPSVFSWSKPKTERSFPIKKALLEEEKKIMEAEETEVASEGEVDNKEAVSRASQVNIEVECSHRMSVSVLRSRCNTHKKETKLFSHFTGFRSYTQFKEFLEFVLPNLNRSKLVFCGTACAKADLIDPSQLFGTPQNKSGTQSGDDEDHDNDHDNNNDGNEDDD